MLKHLRRIDDRGDTIIEVLVVLAVLGLAIGIAYSTANKSLLNTRQAQENSQATQLAQSQVELLRVLAPNGTSAPASSNIFTTTEFCIVDNGAGAQNVILTSDPLFATKCKGTGQSGRFDLKVTYCKGNGAAACASLNGDDNFLITATWDNVLGNGQDTVTLAYRLHPPS